MNEQKELTCERVINEIVDKAREVLKNYAEPDAIGIVVSWKIGQLDFPFGAVVHRNEDQPLPIETTLSCIDQARKMIGYLMVYCLEAPLIRSMTQAQQVIESKDKEIKALQEEVQRLKGG